MRPLCCALAVAAAIAARAEAQGGAPIAVTASGLLSVQPVDSTYVGAEGPYLDRGLGGFGPGVSAGASAAPGRLVFLVEYSAAWIRAEQAGRLVPGGRGIGRLRDSMVTAMAGVELGRGFTRAQLLAGISRVLGAPTVDGSPIEVQPEALRREVLTIGIDVVRSLGTKVGIVVSGRVYPRLARSERAREIGVGRNVFRIGVGLRLPVGGR